MATRMAALVSLRRLAAASRPALSTRGFSSVPSLAARRHRAVWPAPARPLLDLARGYAAKKKLAVSDASDDDDDVGGDSDLDVGPDNGADSDFSDGLPTDCEPATDGDNDVTE